MLLIQFVSGMMDIFDVNTVEPAYIELFFISNCQDIPLGSPCKNIASLFAYIELPFNRTFNMLNFTLYPASAASPNSTRANIFRV